jgi:hypothetical protein
LQLIIDKLPGTDKTVPTGSYNTFGETLFVSARAREIQVGVAATVAITVLAAFLVAPQHAGAASDVDVVADPCTGSSNPTFYASNHRMVTTRGGRLLALYDPDGNDVKLAWKDPGSTWKVESLNLGVPREASSDRPASIALDGRRHGWVVWSGYKFSQELPVRLRRLTDLDAPEGPSVGPAVTVEATGRGNAFADLAFRRGRGFVVWLERTDDAAYSLKATQFNELYTDTPSFGRKVKLYTGSSPLTTGTLVPTFKGMRVVALAGRVRVYAHRAGPRWRAGRAGVRASSDSKPTAIGFRGGILAAFQASRFDGGGIKVARFSSTGDKVSTSLTTGPGYIQPSLTGNRRSAWVVMVANAAESRVVSRHYNGYKWGRVVTEISPDVLEGGDYAFPNAQRPVTVALRFLVDGARCPTSAVSNSVLAYERPVR